MDCFSKIQQNSPSSTFSQGENSGHTAGISLRSGRRCGWVELVFLLVLVVFVVFSQEQRYGNVTKSVESNPDAINKNGIESTAAPDSLAALWPRLKERLCLKSLPNLSLTPLLFELGRIEMGLAANDTYITKNNNEKERHQEATIPKFFFDQAYRFTLFIDGVDPTNTLLYAPIKKAGHTQIHSYLHEILNRNKNGNILDPNSKVGNVNDTYLEMLKDKELESLFHETLEKHGNKNKVDSYYFTFNHMPRTKPCVFTVLRDPISHFLSGYNEIEYRVLSGVHDPGVVPNITEHNDLEKLASYVTISYDDGPQQREERFTTFVRDLVMEHPSFAHFRTYEHMASMSRNLHTLAKFSLLPEEPWFLPTLQNLTEEFPRFLSQRCPRMAFNYHQESTEEQQQHHDRNLEKNPQDDPSSTPLLLLPPMDRQSGHRSSHDPYGTYDAAKSVFAQNGTVARALCVLHVMDYACYNYKLPSIPTICQIVYASADFSDRILLV